MSASIYYFFYLFRMEPVSVSYGTKCDRKNATTCWIEKDIGDTLILAVNISSSKNNSFNVRWIKVYKKWNKKSGVVVKIDPGEFQYFDLH